MFHLDMLGAERTPAAAAINFIQTIRHLGHGHHHFLMRWGGSSFQTGGAAQAGGRQYQFYDMDGE